ncbi:MAG: formyltetrahydrofolate deformylase [Spirochaetales bacterium]|jgi:formyltetrahydrofolate deformylase|nr:formyltetrahydrofolate deformylase [Spirochaetales bacterium]
MMNGVTNPANRAVLLLSCPDVRGIVAEVSHFIFAYNGNILYSDQHTDSETDTFFMRVEWDLEGFRIARDRIRAAFEPIAEKFSMDWRIEFSAHIPRIAIFVSRLDHCLYDLLLRAREGELPCEIVMIVSNHDALAPVAQYFGVPFHVVPVGAGTKDAAEAGALELLREQGIDLVILARYMQVLGDAFVREFRNRIINIHHSFLPAFVGAKPYHQAFERGVKIIGATSHYVTPELDQGPIIEQDVVRISHRDAVSDLVRKGKNLEKIVLSRAVRLHLEYRILIFGNKTVVFG